MDLYALFRVSVNSRPNSSVSRRPGSPKSFFYKTKVGPGEGRCHRVPKGVGVWRDPSWTWTTVLGSDTSRDRDDECSHPVCTVLPAVARTDVVYPGMNRGGND